MKESITSKSQMLCSDSGGEAFRVQVIEVTQALVLDEKGFGLWCEHFLKPYLIAGKSVAVKVHAPVADATNPVGDGNDE
jgi:hypothetical protein